MTISHRNTFPFLAGLALLAASVACMSATEPTQPPASVYEPGMIQTQVASAVAPPAAQEATQAAIQPAPAIPERRRVSLEFPPRIREGDSDIVRLTLEMDELGGITPTAKIEGNQVAGETVEIPNLYETHKVTAEARLDIAGMEVRPSEIISAPLSPGQPVTFYWSVRPSSTGNFKGTAWLFLKFEDRATGEVSERAVSAQTVEIRATDFLGLSAGFARVTGGIGSVVGGIIGFPFFEDIVRLIFRRRRK